MGEIITPIDADKLHQLLKFTKYDKEKTEFLIKGFKDGFDMGYRGPLIRRDYSNNIPFTPGVGDETEMWKKVMKEVELKRY